MPRGAAQEIAKKKKKKKTKKKSFFLEGMEFMDPEECCLAAFPRKVQNAWNLFWNELQNQGPVLWNILHGQKPSSCEDVLQVLK